mgnify:CR=1 FL=1|jgi:hypothetical protein
MAIGIELRVSSYEKRSSKNKTGHFSEIVFGFRNSQLHAHQSFSSFTGKPSAGTGRLLVSTGIS